MRFSSCGRTTTRPRCRNSGTSGDSRSPKDRVFRTPPLQLNVDADIRRGERSVLEARILQDLAALLFSLERQTSLNRPKSISTVPFTWTAPADRAPLWRTGPPISILRARTRFKYPKATARPSAHSPARTLRYESLGSRP